MIPQSLKAVLSQWGKGEEAELDRPKVIFSKWENIQKWYHPTLEELFKNYPHRKVLYINPTGANPTGTLLSAERRKEIYQLCCDYNLLLLEDDPYYYLQFGEKESRPPSFLSLDTQGRVLRFPLLLSWSFKFSPDLTPFPKSWVLASVLVLSQVLHKKIPSWMKHCVAISGLVWKSLSTCMLTLLITKKKLPLQLAQYPLPQVQKSWSNVLFSTCKSPFCTPPPSPRSLPSICLSLLEPRWSRQAYSTSGALKGSTPMWQRLRISTEREETWWWPRLTSTSLAWWSTMCPSVACFSGWRYLITNIVSLQLQSHIYLAVSWNTKSIRLISTQPWELMRMFLPQTLWQVPGISSTWEMIMERGLAANIMLMPGKAFQPEQGKPCQYLRAAFSIAPEQNFEPAMERLADLIRSMDLQNKDIWIWCWVRQSLKHSY